MCVLADVKSRLSGLARSAEDRYSGAEPLPLGGYLATMSVYGVLVGTLAAVAGADMLQFGYAWLEKTASLSPCVTSVRAGRPR